MLQTLSDFGLVDETRDGSGWVIGYELVRLARSADPNKLLVDAARGPVERLRDASGESALFAVVVTPTRFEIVLQADPERRIGVTSWIGADIPLHASSAGKLLLAELDDAELTTWLSEAPLTPFTTQTITESTTLRRHLAIVRKRNWAQIVNELEDGHVSLSVPVRRDGALIGIIGLSGPTFRMPPNRRRDLLVRLAATAGEVTTAQTTTQR